MIRTGILNSHINSLLSRVRHTNTLVISDRGFTSFPGVETIDIALTDDIPRVLDVLRAIQSNFVIGTIWMAEEFLSANSPETRSLFEETAGGGKLLYEPHARFKQRAALALGLIRTADTVQYSNMILESA